MISFTKSIFRTLVLLAFVTITGAKLHAQALSGTYSIPGNYSTIKDAVDALNLNGINGAVTFNIGASAAYTETLTGGIVLGSPVLNSSVSATNTITFQKAATATANPQITAFTGTKTAASTDSIDVMWSIVGTDWVTIDGIDLIEASANTTNTTWMEVGYGLYKASATDGTNNVTIKNCVITLNRNNVTNGSGVRNNIAGSTGIEVIGALRTAVNTALVQTSVAGANSNNKFYSNTIQNCNIGVALASGAVASPYTLADLNNDVGGLTAATGNTIINFGGGTGAGNACAAVFVSNQYGANISNNTINNNDGTGINHPVSNRGVWLFANSPGASCNVNNNTITIKGGANTGSINWCIDMEMAQTGANGNVLNINGNKLLNCTSSPNTTVQFTAIWVNSAASTVNINNNYIYGYSKNSTTGTQTIILSQLAGIGTLNINNNIIDSSSITGVFSLQYGIGVTASTTNLNINGNQITRTIYNSSTTGAGTLYPIFNSGASTTVNANGNLIDSLTRNGTTGGTTIGLYFSSGTNQNVKNNIIRNFYITGAGATSTMYGIQLSGTTVVCDSNQVYNLNVAKTSGTGALYGIYNISAPNNENWRYNKIYNLTHIGTGVVYGLYAFTATGTRNVSYNEIYNLLGSNVVTGILMSSSVPRIFNNRIYNLTTNGTTNIVSGINITSSTAGTAQVFNNLISGIYAPLSNSTTATVIGINLTTTSATTTIGVYHNTVSLDAVSTGANFSSAALLHTANATATTATLDLRNNILVNNSTANGSGNSAVIRRSAATTANYANTSNRNLLYAGTPSANKLIYFNGAVGDSTLLDFKARLLTLEQASVTEQPAFLSLVGSDPGYLHLDTAVATRCESGGSVIAGITFDADNVIRQGSVGYLGTGSAPDIGADEGEFTGIGMVLDSSNVDQNTAAVPVNAINQQVLRIRVHTTNNFTPLVLSSMKLNTSGTTAVADIQNAKVFYTGSNPVFSTTTQYGSTVANPNGVFYMNANLTLPAGVSYFWLTYDVKSTAVVNNFIDARLDSLVIGGINTAPINGDPVGSRKILAPLNGNYQVGNGQTYPTLTAASADLQTLGVSGPVTFILTDTIYNTATGEIFPVTFNAYTGASATNSVSIVPATGNTARIESNNATATLDLNGINFLKIDGRPGATGGFVLGSNLIISNATTVAPAVRFNNEASNNQIIYTDLRANNQSATGTATAGVINFGASTGINGNDNNIIRNCHIHENGGGNPVVSISSIGSAASVAANNDNNIIDSCEIYNFYNASIASAAVYVGANNNSWQINQNKFYQTATLNYTSAVTHRILWITPNTANLTSGSGFIIHNNYLGGNTSAGTGFYTMTGTTAYLFNAMDISVGLGTPTSIQGNIITNFNETNGGGSAINFLGINLVNGNVNCGTVNGNLIGSRTVNGAITYTVTAVNGGASGIRTGGGTGNTFNISNNIISGFDLIGNATTSTPEFFGINPFLGTNVNVTNNMIGDTSLASSIQILSTSATSTYAQRVTGIFANPSSGTPVFNISNNIICNITNAYSATGTQAACTRGIALLPTINGTYTVSNNRIFNLYTNSSTTANAVNATLAGIAANHTAGASVISNNKISNLVLSSTSTTAANQITGIFYSTPATGNNQVMRNSIHTLVVTALNPAAVVNGLDFAAGNGIIANNMIRLGLDSIGNAVQAPCMFRGITKNTGNITLVHNSVYIGGVNIASNNANSMAFQRSGAGTDIVRNNIFVNNRSNASGTGKHYVNFLINTTTLTQNNNSYYGNGTGLVFGTANNGTTDIATFASSWISGDNSSSFANPQFINANGGMLDGDLHISPTLATPVESSGFLISTITEDFDGQLRTGLTPTDIGADAGNFVQLDVFPPVISSFAVSNTASTGDRTFLVNITDQTGIPMSGGVEPRVYFKKFASGSFASAAATRVSGTAQNGTYAFTIPQTLLGGLSINDSVYFYLIAQDSTISNNIASSPGGAIATNVNTVSTEPSTLFSYRIVPGIGGTVLVGSGQTYTTLTGAGGLFEAINLASITSTIHAKITSDIVEPGLNGLNQINETGIGGYQVIIEPDSNIERLISGSFAGNGLIRFNGADRVKIDGRFNGTGRFLRIRNNVQSGHAITFLNDANKDTVTYCHVESVNNTVGTITFSTSTVSGGTGNDSNVVSYCIIRDTLGTPNGGIIQNTGISSSGTAGLENDANVIEYNDIINFGFNAINLNATGMGINWRINNNNIYMTQDARANVYNVIFIQGGNGGHLITQNSVGGSAPNRSGAAFSTTTTTTPGWYGIHITSANTLPINVTNNTFSNISGNTRAVNVIQVTNGVTNILNNTIGGGAMPYDTIRNGYDNGTINITGGTVAIANNVIGNIAYYGGSGDRNSGITVSGGTTTITNNIIRDIKGNSSGTAFTFLITGMQLSGGTNHNVESNTIFNIENFNPGASAYTVAGITITSATNLTLQRNRIYNIRGLGTGGGTASNQVFGIYNAATGNTVIRNNQISIGDNTIGETRVYGIQDVAGSGNNLYYNNTIFVNGLISGGSNNSYCLQRTGLANVLSINNIFYNKRATLGSGAAYALGSASLTGITPATVNYNLMVVSDTTRLAEAPTGFANSVSIFNTLYSGAGTYPSNWYLTSASLLPAQFFVDTLVSNLNIVTTDANAWYAHGKGLALAAVSNDFNNNTRSTSIANGATDIGSHEFTTTTLPPLATASAAPALGSTTHYFFGGKQIASLTWGNAGTVPSAVSVRYYSGANAPNLIAGRTRANAYYDISATGGSGFTFNLTMLVDSANLGNVSGIAQAKMARFDAAWNLISASTANGNTGMLQSNIAQNNIGIFTATDGINNPLPVELLSFNAVKVNADVQLKWITANETNNKGFFIERSTNGREFDVIDFVKGKGNSTTNTSYGFKDVNAFEVLTAKTIYYRLQQVDFDGSVSYSDVRIVTSGDLLDNQITAYPNPFSQTITLAFSSVQTENIAIQVMDINGRMLVSLTKPAQSNLTLNELNDFSNGVYFIKITQGDFIKVIKVIKE
jgi:hypothetical protein